ncbi:MAG TPA: ABC transporter permease [Bryobacteraceae bacterium]
MSLPVASVYGDWNSTFGIQPILGRWFSAAEEKRGDQSGVVVISSSLWHRRFGGERSAIGRTLILDRQSMVIVGVMPDGFHLPHASDAWTPATMVADSVDDYGVVGRLRPGVTLAAAADGVKVISTALMRDFPNRFTVPIRFRLMPIRESMVDTQARPAVTIAATGGFFLLLATFNVAGLLIARSVSRRGEQRIRIALGATRWNLIRGSLAETLVYSAASGLLGVLVAAQAAVPRTSHSGGSGP